jgi:hypothetical protein
MNLLYYLYYKIYKTYNRYHKIFRLYYGPRHHADGFVTMFLFSVPLWVTLKLNLWNTTMGIQFILALVSLFTFFGLGIFVEKKIRTKAIGFYTNETKKQSIFGAILINIFIIVYTFLWFYLLK